MRPPDRTAVVVPLLRKKLGAEKLSELQRWVEIAVHAAEQIFSETGMGARKKEYVREFLKSKGFDIDDEAVDNAIEAAVYDINNAFADLLIDEEIEADVPEAE